MRQPEAHECALYRKIMEAMEERGVSKSSYWVLVSEAVRLCELEERDGGQ